MILNYYLLILLFLKISICSELKESKFWKNKNNNYYYNYLRIQFPFEVNNELKNFGIIPELISEPKNNEKILLARIHFPSKDIKLNDSIAMDSAINQPLIQWTNNDYKFTTIVMVDPDAPSRLNPTMKSWLHFMVIDIPKGLILNNY
jgi:phosphatidylethanolamine-binding protein (PEBP) family uncharacterized protein